MRARRRSSPGGERPLRPVSEQQLPSVPVTQLRLRSAGRGDSPQASRQRGGKGRCGRQARGRGGTLSGRTVPDSGACVWETPGGWARRRSRPGSNNCWWCRGGKKQTRHHLPVHSVQGLAPSDHEAMKGYKEGVHQPLPRTRPQRAWRQKRRVRWRSNRSRGPRQGGRVSAE